MANNNSEYLTYATIHDFYQYRVLKRAVDSEEWHLDQLGPFIDKTSD